MLRLLSISRGQVWRATLAALAGAGLGAGELAGQGYLLNGGFERGLGSWTKSGRIEWDNRTANSGRASARVSDGQARQDMAVPTGTRRYRFSARLKTDGAPAQAPASGAFVRVLERDEFEEVICAHSFTDLAAAQAPEAARAGWSALGGGLELTRDCETVSVEFGVAPGAGPVWFDDLMFAPAEASRTADPGMADFDSTVLRVTILKDDLPPAGAPADPDELARALSRDPSRAVGFLTAAQLADPLALNRDRVDVVILPYGASFPAAAADNFRRFLREGGKFLSIGGYAFDHLLERGIEGWKPVGQAAAMPLDHAIWQYAIPAAELRGHGRLTFTGFLKAAHVRGPGMAYYAIYQTAANGSLPEWKDLCQVRGSQDWHEVRYSFNVHPDAAVVELRAGLYRCQGVACFDDVRLADESGRVWLESGFEEDFEADAPGPRHWRRSHPQRCQVQERTRHAGRRALKVRLSDQSLATVRLNTRHGVPEDGLRVEPTQLGVFDPSYPLERAVYAAAAGRQSIAPEGRIDGEMRGFAASGVVGFEHARWMPLLNAYDHYGRLRGAVGAMLRHYTGPYAGSSWAFFGVTNRNLFALSEGEVAGSPQVVRARQAGAATVTGGGPQRLPAGTLLRRLVDALGEDVYIAALVPDRGCYRQGERARLLGTVVNGGRNERRLRLELELRAGAPADIGSGWGAAPPLVQLNAEVYLEPGQTNAVGLEWAPPRFAADFYHVVARLWDGGRELDRFHSGFVVWDPEVIARGPALDYTNNYLRFGRRPLFLFGTDDWGYVFTTARETPLQWLQDMRQRRDFGVLIYENLQFGMPASPVEREHLWRKVDGIAQLAQQYQQVYFPGLLIGYNTAPSDAELARQADYCRDFARRYARVPGLIYYFNGDLRCELTEAVSPHWNEFLRERYGSPEHWRQAWAERAPSQDLGRLRAEDFNDWGQAWGDVKVYDQNCFRAWLIRRWHTALEAAVRDADVRHPTTSEFYQLPHQGVDLPAGIAGLELGNFGYFERPGADLARFPAICKYNDQRARGKSVGPGEYGVKTHPAWGDGGDYGYHLARTREQALELYLGIAHCSLGLGASRIHNWCWKDDAHRVFPWGMTYPCDNVPKDTLYAHRNQSLLFRHLAPVYEEPAVYVLTADAHRMGGAKWQVIEGILQSLDLVLGLHPENLGTLNEDYLQLPRCAKAIYYPLPFCPPDAAYQKLLEWVRQGGVLYLSGDISYDPWRRRTRTARLEELCGVKFIRELFPPLAVNATNEAAAPFLAVEAAGARVLERTPDGWPLVLQHQVGLGQVVFSTDPLELHGTAARRDRDARLYQSVLDLANVKPLPIEPHDPRLRVFRVPLAEGGQVLVAVNTDTNQPARDLTYSLPPLRRKPSDSEVDRGAMRLRFTLASARPGLVWLDGRGALRAIEAQGECRLGQELVCADQTQGIVLTLDRQDMRRSRALLLMPLRAGRVELATRVRWGQSVVQTGEIQNGRWRTFEQQALRPQAGRITVEVAERQAFSLLLVSEEIQLARWHEALGRAITDPGSLP